MKALILNNKVIEVKENEFPVAHPLKWVDCDDNCEVGWNYDPETGKVSAPVIPKPTNDELLNKLSSCLSDHIKLKASEKYYDSPETVITYIHSTDTQWKDEASKFIAFRDASWLYYLDIDAKVRNGEIECPSEDEFIKNSPTLLW